MFYWDNFLFSAKLVRLLTTWYSSWNKGLFQINLLLSKLYLNVSYTRVKTKIHCLFFKTDKTVLLGVQNVEAKTKEDNGNKVSTNILALSFTDHPRSRAWGNPIKMAIQPTLLIWETIETQEFGKVTRSTRPWFISTGDILCGGEIKRAKRLPNNPIGSLNKLWMNLTVLKKKQQKNKSMLF